ncbi:hypothetical protein M918_20320 [Clostridium sp. BL8]|nr:hypothetical protein [Clostridium sp. BL8]EQB89414.1 hypothetical protein M918_20320 [Clostridium sp. BL8]
MERLKENKQPEEVKKEKVEKINIHILITIKNTLEAISESYKYGKITLVDYNEMLSVIQNLNDYFIDTYNYYKGLSKEVEVMFKSFYDPEVEKRGIVKGIQQGQDKAKIEIARNMISKGFNKVVIIELTGLSEEQVEMIFKERVN